MRKDKKTLSIEHASSNNIASGSHIVKCPTMRLQGLELCNPFNTQEQIDEYLLGIKKKHIPLAYIPLSKTVTSTDTETKQ